MYLTGCGEIESKDREARPFVMLLGFTLSLVACSPVHDLL